MPHIIPVFPEDPVIRAFIVEHKTMLREIVANALGYEVNVVALIPNMIHKEDLDMADNLLPLEFIIDTGSSSVTSLRSYVGVIRNNIVRQIKDFRQINFGVWPRALPSEFSEHKPGDSKKCGMCDGIAMIPTGYIDFGSGEDAETICPCCGETVTKG